MQTMVTRGDLVPRIGGPDGGQPVIAAQRLALQIDTQHRHVGPGTYYSNAGEGPAIPRLEAEGGTTRANLITEDNEPWPGYVQEVLAGRELTGPDFEEHESLEERLEAIDRLVDETGIPIVVDEGTPRPAVTDERGEESRIPPQEGRLEGEHCLRRVYGAALALAVREIEPSSERDWASAHLAAALTTQTISGNACVGEAGLTNERAMLLADARNGGDPASTHEWST